MLEGACDVVADAGGAHLGDGEAAGGDDDGVGGYVSAGGVDEEAVGFGVGGRDRFDCGAGAGFDVGGDAFGFEHDDDLLRAAVAEELAEGFFVEGDVVLLDEGNEVAGGVAREGGAGEVRIFAEVVVGGDVGVGEVAAAAAGDKDFAAYTFAVFDQEGAASAFAGFDGGHHACGTCSEDDDVVMLVHFAVRLPACLFLHQTTEETAMKALPWIIAGAGVAAAAYILYNTPGPEYATGSDTIEGAARNVAQWGSKRRITGKGTNVVGKVKEGFARVTGDADLADEGVGQQIAGGLEDAAGAVAQAAGKTLHEFNR